MISSSSDDDILGIEPLELRFAIEPNKEISDEVELTNKTGNYVAFNINTRESQLQYCAEPNKGIVRPRSKRTVKIILLQAQEIATKESMPHADEFIVQSTKVAAADKEITEDMFNNEAGNKVVDEVSVMVVI
ncbi:hypothetical protein U9M48_031937 [Paspalum notatum var. saurae]|uniref:MSP domain-containing protein n=1 Tax=Paspalum notatum var. saurae TaxID=547442 RepID=A0AAQ3X495_PASNO